jgi:hypothetical protein
MTGGTDDFGCPTGHPLSLRPALRPARPVDVATLHGITSVSACKYELPLPGPGPQPRPLLVSALRLDGAIADRAIREIARSRAGGGPDHPENCSPEVAHGEGFDAVVLRVHSAAGDTEIFLRYAGCVGNGFDDGVRLRQLTTAATSPFLAGPNTVIAFASETDVMPTR